MTTTQDPTLKTASITIKYTASDGYKMVAQFDGGGKRSATAEDVLLAGIDELARLAALFGLQDKADQMMNEAIRRVANWRASQ